MRFTSIHVVLASALAALAASCGSSSASDANKTPVQGFNHEVPCEIAQILSKHCLECHSDPPTQSAPESLVTYAQISRPSTTDPTQTEAQLGLVRMQSSFSPMPPAGKARVTPEEIATWQAWVDNGAPQGSCSGPNDTGTGGGGAGGSTSEGQGGGAGDTSSQGGSDSQGGADSQGGGAGSGGTDGGGSGGTDGGGGSPTTTGVPCDIATFLATKCDGCHGSPPAQGTPTSMLSLEDLLAPAPSDPTKRVADVIVTRLSAVDSPMPPLPNMPATPAEIMAFTDWVNGGLQPGTCLPATSGDGGDGGNPYNTPVICSSQDVWPGTTASAVMGPGEACIKCHKDNGAFIPVIGGTVYPTAHEPDDCFGAGSLTIAKGATVTVTDANGTTFTTAINSGGNFYMTTKSAKGFTPPYTAIVKNMGRVRQMVTKQTSGDCNGCHTQDGTTTVTDPANSPKAPGRILLP